MRLFIAIGVRPVPTFIVASFHPPQVPQDRINRAEDGRADDGEYEDANPERADWQLILPRNGPLGLGNDASFRDVFRVL